MAQCVFCSFTQNLNTQLGVTLEDGTKVVVLICDTHSEDATVKTARAAYMDKQKQIDAVLEQAKALGLNITGFQQQGAILVPTVAQQPQQVAQPDPIAAATAAQVLTGEDVVATEVLDSRRGMVSVGGTTDFGSVAGHQSHDVSNLKSKLPEAARKGKAKMTMVEAREGMPIAIPETRVDGTGTTRIKIHKKETDGTLQHRFKRMAKDSIERDKTPNFAREGYQNTQADCPICRGACTIRQNVGGVVKDVPCPKCGGMGFISLV
jgi:hypothetical protein